MADVSNWRSSEYSQEAEELFADYVRRERAGDAPPFELFCGEHPEVEDELQGLRIDWENVCGVIERLMASGAMPSPAPEPTAVAAAPPAEPAPELPGPPPALVEPQARVEPPVPASRPPRRPGGVRALGIAGLLLLGGLSALLLRQAQVLAAERVRADALQAESASLATAVLQRDQDLHGMSQEFRRQVEAGEQRLLAVEEARRLAEQQASALEEQLGTLEAHLELGRIREELRLLTAEGEGDREPLDSLLPRVQALRTRLESPEGLESWDALDQELRTRILRAEALELAPERWARAAESVASLPAYAGLTLVRQPGLLLLELRPEGDLLQFYFLVSGGEPAGAAELGLVLHPPGPGHSAFFLALEPMSPEQAAAWGLSAAEPAWLRAAGVEAPEPPAILPALLVHP